MPINLTQTAIDPVNDPNSAERERFQMMMQDTQGNILKSHGRDHSSHIFLTFDKDIAAAREWLADMAAGQVTSAWQQFTDAQAFRANGADGGLFTNLALSAKGYAALGIAQDAWPDDPSFRAGATAAINRLLDPPRNQWEAGFQKDLHALVILADDDPARLEAEAEQLMTAVASFATVAHCETGAAMRVKADGTVYKSSDGGPKPPVHEHFGFADGVSQPLFLAKDIEASRLNSGGFDRYDPSAPLDLVLLKDPLGADFGYGSYFVYRKLEQDVAGFRKAEAELADTLAKERFRQKVTQSEKPTEADQKLAAAYIVGRFRDGTPVAAQAVDGWTNEPNNFNYDQDADGLRCPFHAHTRKTNPRGDKARAFATPQSEERSRRIVRRAISYGELSLEPKDPVGLLFLSAQSSIVDQFEFMQRIWCNFTDFLRFGTGIDTVIGQAPDGKPTVPESWPLVYGMYNTLNPLGDEKFARRDPYVKYQFGQFVTMRGGEYFFVPSMSALKNLAHAAT